MQFYMTNYILLFLIEEQFSALMLQPSLQHMMTVYWDQGRFELFWFYEKINLVMPTYMWFLTDNVGGEKDVIENCENLKHSQPFWHPIAQTVDFHVLFVCWFFVWFLFVCFVFTFHRSKLCYKNLKNIEIFILL